MSDDTTPEVSLEDLRRMLPTDADPTSCVAVAMDGPYGDRIEVPIRSVTVRQLHIPVADSPGHITLTTVVLEVE